MMLVTYEFCPQLCKIRYEHNTEYYFSETALMSHSILQKEHSQLTLDIAVYRLLKDESGEIFGGVAGRRGGGVNRAGA